MALPKIDETNQKKSFVEWSGRKYILALVTIALVTILPIVYQWMQVDSSVTLTVLGIIGAVSGGYSVTNVLQDKFLGSK